MLKYIVANPRGIPKKMGAQRIPIFRQGDKAWYEGDVYDGKSPAEPLRRGFLIQLGEVPGD